MLLSVCVMPSAPENAARTVACGHYIHEILGHAGLAYGSVSLVELARVPPALKVLITVGEQPLTVDLVTALQDWAMAGGAWLAIGGVCGASHLFGGEVERPAYESWGGGLATLGEGYLDWSGLPEGDRPACPLHYFNGIPVQAAGGTVLATVLDSHQRPTSRAGLLENKVGNGWCMLLAPDVTGTIVHIQQGIAVTRDGVPAPDGTAPVADGVLKSDDGAVLDWIFDRQPVPGVPGFRAFLQPVADEWRRLVLWCVFRLASRAGVSLPLLWLYPGDLPALGQLSHDTDGNDPRLGFRLLELLSQLNIVSTWCTILPGYPAPITEAIRAAGHELAMHFDAMSPGAPWTEAAFKVQWDGLTALFEGIPPVTNKNHYLRWEGDCELYEWCARYGIRLDQSKGASKTGEAGFNFGTCHPYFPVSPDGRFIDVLELPTPTQDLEVFAPGALLEPLLEQVLSHYGVLHLLFHPAHIEKPGVAAAIANAVEKARQHGMEWWTAKRLGDWERRRRRARWRNFCSDTGISEATLEGDWDADAPTLLLLVPEAHGTLTVRVNKSEVPSRRVERWGFPFEAVTLEAMAPRQCLIEWSIHD